MVITVSKDEVKVFEKLKSISHMVPLNEKIRFFEEKHGCTPEEFEGQLKAEPEDFKWWDFRGEIDGCRRPPPRSDSIIVRTSTREGEKRRQKRACCLHQANKW
jgi:hypothetical protein